MNRINIIRVYDPQKTDGSYRVLVDRLWPRGIRKADLHLDEWNKELAPSSELRNWFDHKPERFEAFAQRYREELKAKEAALERLRKIAETRAITLLYGARDPEINQAIVLKALLESGGFYGE